MQVDLSPREIRALLEVLDHTPMEGPESWAVGLGICQKLVSALKSIPPEREPG